MAVRPAMQNFSEVFDAAAGRFSERVAVEVQRRDRVEAFRYADLARMAGRAARWLAGRGVGAGDRCALLAENDAHWCAAYLGVLRLGAVAVPLDTAYKAAQVATILADSGARVVFTSPRHLADVRDACAALAARGIDDRLIVLLHGAADDVVAFEALADDPTLEAAGPPAPAGPADPAVILYTSGTTSDPKGVVLTHGNLLAERDAVFRVVYIDERDAVLSVLPLFHALAQVANLLLPLSAGARVIFLESVNTTELLRALAERDVSAFCCVPQFFYLIHQRVLTEVGRAGLARRAAFRLLVAANGALRRIGINAGPLLFGRVHRTLGPRMRLLITGGSRFDPAIARDLYRLGLTVLQAYGLTETSGAATITRPGDLHSVGLPVPGVEIRIVRAAGEAGGDAAGDTGADPREGEIAIRGPIVMEGYFRRADATAAALRDRWLHTGDLGYLDEGGRLHITGRQKEVIVLSSGKNIYPEEIEAHYRQSPVIKELCVLGVTRPDEPAAERLHAVVVPDVDVLRERKVVNMRELVRFEIEGLSVQLPSHKRVQGFEVTLDALPRTTTGKIKRFEIERRLAPASGAAPAERPWREEDAAWAADAHAATALEIVRDAARARADRPAVHPDANLELDLGLDSMERVELLAGLEQRFGVKVPLEVAQRIYTVRELVDAVRPSAGARAPRAPAAPAWSQVLAAAPEDDPLLAGLLAPKRWLAAALFVAVRLALAAARLAVRVHVTGHRQLPRAGPFLLSPNHQSYLDAFFLCAVLPFRTFRDLFFVGASEYFRTPVRQRLARAVNVVPVDPDANLVRAMQAGAFGLRHGKVLILFPEGERSMDGAPKVFKKGAAILSTHLRAPIVPVAIDGLYGIWARNRPVSWRALRPWRRPRVRLRFGAPLAPPLPDGATSGPGAPADADYAATTERLRRTVVEMWEGLKAAPP